jgi:6-phosphogluconolactonase
VHRRTFLASSTAGAAGLLTGCAPGPGPAAAPRPAAAPPDGDRLVFVGTYTSRTASRGLYRFRVDAAGAWTPLGPVDVGPDPSFLAVHPSGRVLYVVNETTTYEGAPSGAVRALAIDRATGALTPLGAVRPTGGGAPCYVSVDAGGRMLLVANYVGGSVAAFPLDAAGAIGARSYLDQHAGRGPQADRQEGPHAHSVLPDPSDRWAVSADLGIDRVTVHALDAAAGTLAPVHVAALRPGMGPRHLAFHPGGRLLYVVGELDLTLATLAFDPARGTLTEVATVPLLASAAPAGSTAADVHVHPSGGALWVSVRGDDSLAHFALDAAGRATRVGRVASGGRTPRNFALAPGGARLWAANQRSDVVVAFAVAADGGLAATGERVEVPAPVCVRFA